MSEINNANEINNNPSETEKKDEKVFSKENFIKTLKDSGKFD